MAVRKKLNHDERTREKIQASQLVNALQNHTLGLNEMSATQIQAARILLGKCLPDLQAVEHSAKDGVFETTLLVKNA